MAVAMRNTQNSTSMLQTADGALGEVSNILVRMKDLSTQAADASSTSDDKDAMQSEFDALGNELNNIMKNTTFGGKALLSGGTIASSMTFQIGASSTEQMTLDLSATGTVGSMADLDTALGAVTAKYAAPGNTAGTELGSATTAMDNIKAALDKLGATRSALGGAANRLDHVFNNLSNISTNTQNATGRIMDVDFATESSSMTSNQMLMQAGTAMLKQTNSMSSMVMSLLQ
jgi:flagellin